MKRIICFLWIFLLAAPNAVQAGKTFKILVLGNSFSEDAVEQNLHELAAAAGIKTVIGNMYIPGCPLHLHMQNAEQDAGAYRYRKIGTDGIMEQIDSVRISSALTDESWDYVSVQQVSHLSGLYETYQPYLHKLIAYIRARVPHKTKIVFHQTWAYAQNSTREGYENYGKNQLVMFDAILNATERATKEERIKVVIPVGTAIQNARTSSYGDTMTRDGFHLDLTYGRYTAACTWFAKLFRRKAVGNAYAPKGMTHNQVLASQEAADAAVNNPKVITVIER